MNVYDSNGYVDFSIIGKLKTPFIFITGGRGTGKTFGSLKYAYENNLTVFYLRRTQKQCDIISKPQFSPYKALNSILEINVETKRISTDNSAFYDGDRILAYTGALSTMSNVRGFNAEDVDIIIYDEFIPELHERPIKNEASALFNAYETINRNRELNGKPPVILLCLSNSNNISNPIYAALDMIKTVNNMVMRGNEVYTNQQKGFSIVHLLKSPVSERKSATSLYRLTENTDFYDMSIDNVFTGVDYRNIKSMPLVEFRAVAKIGNAVIYRHKSRPFFYVSAHRAGGCREYTTNDTHLFSRDNPAFISELCSKSVIFESIQIKLYLTDLLF